MNCKEIQELLPAYTDGALEAEAAADVRSHLSACHACREEERLLTASWDALGALPVIKPSPDFRARFWERVRREELEEKKWWGVFLPKQLVPVAAGFMVIWTVGVAGGLFFFNNRPPQTSPLEKAAVIFTSPLPPNSIEQIYLQGQPHTLRRQNT